MTIPLEDLFNDVLGKAQRGLGLSDDALCTAASVSPDILAACKAGTVHDDALLRLAPVLPLHGPSRHALAHGTWSPPPVQMGGLARFNTAFGDMTVNAYLLWDPASKAAAAFDTGADAQPMLDFIANHGLHLQAVFITHTHGDHIAALEPLLRATGCPHAYSHSQEPCPGTTTFDIPPATAWTIGALHITPRSTHGHARGGVTYLVTGLPEPVAIVGDALFASSMGGGMISWTDALTTNRREIFTLPDHTILCPGHGPYTTVREEKLHNPFYPEFK